MGDISKGVANTLLQPAKKMYKIPAQTPPPPTTLVANVSKASSCHVHKEIKDYREKIDR
jgi:hypothetical protein